MASTSKRKRDRGNHKDAPAAKRPTKPSSLGSPTDAVIAVKRDLLEQCYPFVQSLRQYLLAKLPLSSRLRRKKIASLSSTASPANAETSLGHLLDTTLVATFEQADAAKESPDLRWELWQSFSQKDDSYVTISDSSAAVFSQAEIVDFVVWLLFSREKKYEAWPKHLLCDGFRRNANGRDAGCAAQIPGLFVLHPNSQVAKLRETPWPQVLALLGRSGEKVMIDLLLDCSIFVTVQAGSGNYYQLSGIPLSELDSVSSSRNTQGRGVTPCRRPSDIAFVRSRIFYAKPTLSARGLVQAGFKHIHALNRYHYKASAAPPCPAPISKTQGNTLTSVTQIQDELNTTKLMMYIFPRQFQLHNVFSSEVDRQQTAQKFQDYTLREEEIARLVGQASSKTRLPKLPKRLRGGAHHLVQRLQIRHDRCSYIELLKHYCPVPMDSQSRDCNSFDANGLSTIRGYRSKPGPSQATRHSRRAGRKPTAQLQDMPKPSFTSLEELACPVAHVSAFCQAVLSKIIPDGFWGEGEVLGHNKRVFLQKVDQFIKLRRFETMTLHEAVQGLKVADITWLQQPSLMGHKPSKTDIDKRYEMFHEFVYYAFDSLLIPLLRSNFYVTETNRHRYQIFYFRHDMWKRVAEPAMATLKQKMFEEVKLGDATRILDSRRLGFSQIRLLPKKADLRPIMNLRRRALGNRGSKVLGPSINSILSPVHLLLKLEKDLNPSKLASTMFSIGDIYARLKQFQEGLMPDERRAPLYFVKVDVQSAFDTIPQAAVIELMLSVPSQEQYTLAKHVEMHSGERIASKNCTSASKPTRRWQSNAVRQGDSTELIARLEGGLADRKRDIVFIDSAVRKTHRKADLLRLLADHINNNLVRVGKKYYRQKTGIPQGSVLSSFLCNYFYADLERRHLDFLDGRDSLLLRLIDDFLLITQDKGKAVRFAQTMHKGFPEYGVQVSLKKTLVNFDVIIDETPAPQIPRGGKFPYCGTMIDCQTLEITKDRERGGDIHISSSLTVDFSRLQGQNFQKKVLSSFKIQSHLMFYDTALNSAATVLKSLHDAFCETATKMWAYIRCLPKPKRPAASLVTRTIVKVMDMSFSLLTSKSRRLRYDNYACSIRKGQVLLTGCEAFLEVLGRKQAGYEQVIVWLHKEKTRLEARR